MTGNRLPFKVRQLSSSDIVLNKLKQKLRNENLEIFSKKIRDLLKEHNIMVQFEEKVELSVFDKETDNIEDIYSYGMDKEIITLGKSPNNDIVKIERYISREHAIFKFTEKGIVLIDKGSTNGTYINGVRLQPNEPHLLSSDDILHFGAQKIKFNMKKEALSDIELVYDIFPHLVKKDMIVQTEHKVPFFICRTLKSNKLVICDFDRQYFYDIINSLLGFGESDDFLYEKPITKIETGVFLYIFLLYLEILNKTALPKDDLLIFEKTGNLDDMDIKENFVLLSINLYASDKRYGIRIFIEGDTFDLRADEEKTIPPDILDLISEKPLELHLIAGETKLSIDDIRSINNQTILIIDDWYLKGIKPNKDDIIILRQPDTNISLRARIIEMAEKSNVKIDQILKKENLSMNEYDTEKSKVLGSLETTVYIMLASKKIPLSELSNIRKGDIMTFEENIGNTVQLIVNNTVFAKGELIEYEGKTGVEILDVML